MILREQGLGCQHAKQQRGNFALLGYDGWSVEKKRKPLHAFRRELTVGNDYVSFSDGCNENFNHCSLRPDL